MRRGALAVEVVDDLDRAARCHAHVGVDIPIGLPDAWGRAADDDARAVLGRRASTVFPVVPRPLLGCHDHAGASARARERYGRGVSVQAWNLVPKIVAVDALARHLPEDRLLEVHPECSFAALAGHPLASKHTPGGVASRSDLLRATLGEAVDACLDDRPPRGSRIDDVLDAVVVWWSAMRFARGTHVTLGDGARDSVGLAMRIVS